jgi:nitronate monooxygenase
MATKEAPIHEHVKQRIVANDERQTDLIFRTMHNTARVGRNAISQKVVEIENEGLKRGGAKFEEVRDLVAGTRGKGVLETGDMDAGIWSAGQVQGLINDIPTCKELVERIVREAEAIIRGRLSKAIAA